jgi:hypothetical protein
MIVGYRESCFILRESCKYTGVKLESKSKTLVSFLLAHFANFQILNSNLTPIVYSNFT